MTQYLLARLQDPWTSPHTDAAPAQRADWTRAQPVAPVKLTRRQHQIYTFIRWYQRMWGESPLYREIAEHCGLQGGSTVQYQIRQLVGRGLIRKPRRLVRVIWLTHVPVKLG
jgi:DNA-binding MarR family transcriptional regulator